MVNHPNRKLSPGVRALLARVKEACDGPQSVYLVDATDERERRQAALCEREGWLTLPSDDEGGTRLIITDVGRAIVASLTKR